MRHYDDASQPDRPIRVNLTEEDARKVAGELRDGMTDAQCGVALTEGWNITAVQKTKFQHPTIKQRKAHSHMAAQISADVRRARQRPFLHSTDVDVDKPIPYRPTGKR